MIGWSWAFRFPHRLLRRVILDLGKVMDEYLDVEEACVKGRSGQFVHGDMDGGREEGLT